MLKGRYPKKLKCIHTKSLIQNCNKIMTTISCTYKFDLSTWTRSHFNRRRSANTRGQTPFWKLPFFSNFRYHESSKKQSRHKSSHHKHSENCTPTLGWNIARKQRTYRSTNGPSSINDWCYCSKASKVAILGTRGSQGQLRQLLLWENRAHWPKSRWPTWGWCLWLLICVHSSGRSIELE